jgi:hypothetical protein
MHEVVLSLLREGTSEERMLAVVAAGQLRDLSAWRPVRQLAETDDPDLSVAAAHSLMRIDAARAVSLVVRQIGRRGDWPSAKVAAILQEAGPDSISSPLAITALYARGEHAPRVVAYLSLIHPDIARATVRQIVESGADARVRDACAHVLRNLNRETVAAVEV